METTNQNKVWKRAIVLCWIALAFCFIIKICGGNFFAIAVEDERFIAVCSYIDNNRILLDTISLINYLLMSIIYYSATFNQISFSKKQFLILIPIFISVFFLKIYFIYLGSILELLLMIFIPIILKKCKWYWSVIYVVIYNVFGFISMFVKSIGAIYLPDYTLIGLIFSIDVYFMLILFMLYNNEKLKEKK